MNMAVSDGEFVAVGIRCNSYSFGEFFDLY